MESQAGHTVTAMSHDKHLLGVENLSGGRLGGTSQSIRRLLIKPELGRQELFGDLKETSLNTAKGFLSLVQGGGQDRGVWPRDRAPGPTLAGRKAQLSSSLRWTGLVTGLCLQEVWAAC